MNIVTLSPGNAHLGHFVEIDKPLLFSFITSSPLQYGLCQSQLSLIPKSFFSQQNAKTSSSAHTSIPAIVDSRASTHPTSQSLANQASPYLLYWNSSGEPDNVVCYRRRRLLLLSLATSGMDLSCRRHHHWNPLLIHSVLRHHRQDHPWTVSNLPLDAHTAARATRCRQDYAKRIAITAVYALAAKILIPPHLKQRQNHLIPEPPTTSNHLPAALDSPDLSYGQDQRPAQDAYPDRTVSLDCIIGLIQRINSVQAATDAKHDMIQSVLSCLQRCRISLNMILQTAYTLPAMASISSHAAAVQTLQEIASRGRFQLDILIYTYVLGALCRYAPENSNDPQQFADALPKPWIDQTYIAVLSGS
ncbi:hypothetical protein BASA83_007693 [Batrachochytrium salamandrivorans]|nr:hypothetical protein BASA83_007693 [Batrachochytrium salamandrivorans]